MPLAHFTSVWIALKAFTRKIFTRRGGRLKLMTLEVWNVFRRGKGWDPAEVGEHDNCRCVSNFACFVKTRYVSRDFIIGSSENYDLRVKYSVRVMDNLWRSFRTFLVVLEWNLQRNLTNLQTKERKIIERQYPSFSGNRQRNISKR